MSLKALLFDVDGTLADTEGGGHLPAYNAAFADHGLDWHWTPRSYRQLLDVSGGRSRIRSHAARFDRSLADRSEAFRSDPDRWAASIHAAKCRHFDRLLAAGAVALRPGVARVLDECRQAGVAVMLVSNASRATLESVVSHVIPGALRDDLAGMICGDDVDQKKPAPDGYLAACHDLDCRPDEAMAIEDSAIGLAAARAAGIAALITYNDETAGHDFTGAVAVLDGLGEPDAPVRIDHAPTPGLDYVDLAVLQRLHRGADNPSA